MRGDYYTGHWKDDMKHGEGTLVSSKSTKYIGTFYQDRKHGKGEMHVP